MTNSGDAAEQMVRMSLDGVEVAARITGSAAKEIAIMLIAAMKNSDKSLKLKGRARLSSMLKSGSALEIFSVRDNDLKSFMQGAKQYGVVYCVLRNKNSPDGLCDVLVRADDAPRLSRLVERLKLATVDRAKIENEVAAEKGDKTAGTEPEGRDTEKLLDDLLGTTEGKKIQEQLPKEANSRPFAGSPSRTRPSAPTSESRSRSARGISGKPSVKEELREITAAIADRHKNAPVITHKQPQISGKLKFRKERS